jgi:hypothetical protein
LHRQLKDIERRVDALPRSARVRLGVQVLREIGQASRSEFPHLYGTPPEARYQPWGQGTAIGYARTRSGNHEGALRGIALWLAVAYHETRDSEHAALQALHRQWLRVVRELKESRGVAEHLREWLKAGAAA